VVRDGRGATRCGSMSRWPAAARAETFAQMPRPRWRSPSAVPFPGPPLQGHIGKTPVRAGRSTSRASDLCRAASRRSAVQSVQRRVDFGLPPFQRLQEVGDDQRPTPRGGQKRAAVFFFFSTSPPPVAGDRPAPVRGADSTVAQRPSAGQTRPGRKPSHVRTVLAGSRLAGFAPAGGRDAAPAPAPPLRTPDPALHVGGAKSMMAVASNEHPGSSSPSARRSRTCGELVRAGQRQSTGVRRHGLVLASVVPPRCRARAGVEMVALSNQSSRRGTVSRGPAVACARRFSSTRAGINVMRDAR